MTHSTNPSRDARSRARVAATSVLSRCLSQEALLFQARHNARPTLHPTVCDGTEKRPGDLYVGHKGRRHNEATRHIAREVWITVECSNEQTSVRNVERATGRFTALLTATAASGGQLSRTKWPFAVRSLALGPGDGARVYFSLSQMSTARTRYRRGNTPRDSDAFDIRRPFRIFSLFSLLFRNSRVYICIRMLCARHGARKIILHAAAQMARCAPVFRDLFVNRRRQICDQLRFDSCTINRPVARRFRIRALSLRVTRNSFVRSFVRPRSLELSKCEN